MKNHIIIQDWAGNILYKGHYKNKEVDRILDTNRCVACGGRELEIDHCHECDNTGYSGDLEVYWIDEDERNVYEYINY